MKVGVELAMIVREVCTVVLEIPDDEDFDTECIDDYLHEIYDNYDLGDFTADESWGADEGTHSVFELQSQNVRPDFRIVNGIVELVQKEV